MKRPQPDLEGLQLQAFLESVGGVRKFLRLWGTTTVNGVEVLHRRRYTYPSTDRPANFEKLFKYLGLYEDVVNADYKGIKKAWMYLNKNNGVVPPSNLNDFVASNLNSMWWDPADGAIPPDLTLTTTVVIESLIDQTRSESVSTTSLLNPYWTVPALITAVENNYDTLWDTCTITHQGVGVISSGGTTDTAINVTIPDTDDLTPNDPWLGVFSRNVLRTHGPTSTIKDVAVGYGKTEEGRFYPTYVVTIEIPYSFVNTGSLFVEGIVNDLTGIYTSKTRKKRSFPNGYYTKKAITGMDSSDLEDDPSLVSRSYRLWEDESAEQNALFQALWYKYDGKWYLRADALRNPRNFGLTYREVNYYLWPLLDSGYQKKSVPWWKKALAVVVFIIAVVGSFFTGGATLTWASASASLLAGALVLTVLTLVAGIAGEHGWASAFASVSKELEPLLVVATLITLTTALKAGYDKALKTTAEALKKDVAEVTTGEVAQNVVESLVSDYVDSLVKGATDVASGTLSKEGLKFVQDLSSLVMAPEKNKLDTINDRNKDLKTEYEELTKELSREYDTLRGFSQVYAKPATSDWSMYAAVFDQPYERGGGPLALGNIQRTTKQALRKADYSDTAFTGIIDV